MFQQRKNKRYSYKPRFGDESKRTRANNFNDKWNEVRESSVSKRKKGWSLKVLLILLIILIAVMYYLEKYYL